MKTLTIPPELEELMSNLSEDFTRIAHITTTIKNKLEAHADGKQLKGDEITGWLGEVYTKMLVKGRLVSDELDYDVVVDDMRISAKARKGSGNSWEITSTIPRIEGEDCPTHLMFIKFNADYSIDRVWLFPWIDLRNGGRFKPKKVRGGNRGYYVRISPSKDKEYLFYDSNFR